MGEQLQFKFMELFNDKYIPPDYIKFYTIFQYDRFKFKRLLRKEIEKHKPKDVEEFKKIQNRILKQCYIKDEKGNRKRDTDEKHIFRYATLQKICHTIYSIHIKSADLFGTSFFNAIKYFDDEQQAEIKNTWHLPVSERVKIHIRLLRELRKLVKVTENNSYDI